MTRVTLLHNDDETLDPADSSLRARGPLKIDGHERGTWEAHRDGRWTALLDGASIEASSKDALIAQIETRVV
ncbi:hypothetical protein BVER_04076c [Candidatus Burkholderia verschuerenii]|uniref:Uncharacterized protein n=1 Tax=Candidatus Burkholderia verschuerenii TaxID=242163 RepID=A0A0L0M4B3_9BURK|nr:hypothetical protein [Candidatus Burkholderia verschuerenii]KND56844.1 hypothetical protein BVER_04076c [Candidatus Burkholderia verschuerenii]